MEIGSCAARELVGIRSILLGSGQPYPEAVTGKDLDTSSLV